MLSPYKNYKKVLVKTRTKCILYEIGKIQSNRILDINGKLIICWGDNEDNVYVRDFRSVRFYGKVLNCYDLLVELIFS